VRHKGRPDYELAAQLADELPVPMMLSGGMNDAEHIARVFEHTGVEAVMLARGCLGNPWLFEQTLGRRHEAPSREEILDELEWVVERGVEHLGPERAARYLKKFYPWYVDRLGESAGVQDAFQRADSIAAQRALVERLRVLQPA
jgi:tRNA-dihydrouridine synthase